MTTYKVTSPNFVGTLSIHNDKVTEASPSIAWSVGRDWLFARTVITQRGWKIEPIIAPSFELEHPTITYRGIKYTIYTEWGVIRRITSTDRDDEIKDLTYAELPEELKAIL